MGTTNQTSADLEMDDSEMWRIIKKERQEKRAGNRESSSTILATRSIPFESKNGGAHLIVTYGAEVVDFWPGTGRWRFRGYDLKGFGVFNLLKALDVPNTATKPTTTKKEQ